MSPLDRSLFRLVADNDSGPRVAVDLDPIDAALVPGWYAAPESFRQLIRLLVALETGQLHLLNSRTHKA
jgi:hypothetical protein